MRDAHLKVLADSQKRESNRAQQASWSNKGYVSVVSEILEVLCDPWALDRVQLDVQPPDGEESAYQEDARLFFRLLVRMASQRSWSMVWQSECQPNNWCGVIDKNLRRAKERLERIQKDAEIIETAWQRLSSRDESCDLEACLF